MNTLTIPAYLVRQGDILCTVAGAPCARVADVIGTEDSCVWVSAYNLGGDCWFPVTFDVEETATVLREEFAVGATVHVNRDRRGFPWCSPGQVVAVVNDDPHPYMVAVNGAYARFAASEVQPAETLASTGRPSKAPVRIAALAAGSMTALALAVVLAQPTSTPEPAPAPHFIRQSTATLPYRPTPDPALTSHTSREGARKALTEVHLVAPSSAPSTPNPIATPPADIRISFYTDCTGHAQRCIDEGTLTMYAGRILAGHNYMGYQWLSGVPVGRTVRVIHGPLAGTYEVYGHLHIDRQGGEIPEFAGAPELVLQTCEGSGTGFTLLRAA